MPRKTELEYIIEGLEKRIKDSSINQGWIAIYKRRLVKALDEYMKLTS